MTQTLYETSSVLFTSPETRSEPVVSSTWNVFSDACSRGMLGCSSLISQFSWGNYKWLRRNTAKPIMLDCRSASSSNFAVLSCMWPCTLTPGLWYCEVGSIICMFLHFHTFSALRTSKNCMEGLHTTPTADWISIVDSHMTLLLIQILYQDFVRHIFPQQNDLSLW